MSLNEIEALAQEYERTVRLPWDASLAGPQKVWFAIYDPAQERRLRLHVSDFEMATVRAKHTWLLIDITDSFAHWMAGHEYKEAYFEQPEDMDLALQDYADHVADEVVQAMIAPSVDENTVVAILGIGSLFGLARASVLLDAIAAHIRGRLLVFFPGRRDGSNYRLLDARDGWNYLAVPISAADRK
jgi:hypothetical protein